MMGGMPLLEIICLTADDARAAEAGGADRIELVGTMDDDGLSPTAKLVEEVVAATSLPVRAMVRVRGGFGAPTSDIERMAKLDREFGDAGAEGLVLGFLTEAGEIDREALRAILQDCTLPWTFNRAIDHTANVDHSWAQLMTLPGLDQVLTAGSPYGVEHGIGALIKRVESGPWAASRVLVGGGLTREHVPALIDAGAQGFHIGSAVRPAGNFSETVDTDAVRGWRELLDHAAQDAGNQI
jgi:copper homeostasis protein